MGEMRDRDRQGADETARITAWIEGNLGGRVVAIERQLRWRPVWFATVEHPVERPVGSSATTTIELCVRGERVDTPGLFPLRHEMVVQELLEGQGVLVPHVYGWCDDPPAYVMDRVPGSNDFADATDEERAAVMDQYLGILTQIHALDVQPFADAGVPRASRPEDAALVGMQAYERLYRSQKRRPDPFLEFCLGWLARNPLDNQGRESLVVWDSGQFHHHGGRVTAVLDLELAHVGDPLMDLAAFRQRDTIIGYGDPRVLYARYAELSGTPVDLTAIRHHHFAFTLANQLAFHGALADPPPASDYMTNLQWCSETNLFAVEALADILGLELPPVDPPPARTSPVAVAHAHLVGLLRSVTAADAFDQYRMRGGFRLARHLQRFDEIGDEVVAADLDDLVPFLGERPATWQEGDAALEAYVLADGGTHDEQLVRVFHRRLTRAHQLLGPPGSAMTRHHTVAPID
jgi:aminoglycoside phosphotransferase (APT) family kinase protein